MSRSQRPVWLGEDERKWDHVRIHIVLLDDERVGIYEFAVYAGLARHAEVVSGDARPSIHTLARYAGCSPRKAREAMRNLESAGYVATSEQPGHASSYRLLPTGPRHVVPPSADATPAPEDPDPGTTVNATPARPAAEQEPVNENQEREDAPAIAGAIDRNLPAIVANSAHLADARALCEHLAGQLAARGYQQEARQSTGVRALRDMEALLRLDGLSPGQIQFALDWLDAGADKVSEFWRRNIRSPGSLRAKLPRLREEYAAMKSKPARGENFGLDRDAVDRIQQQARNGNGHPTNGHTGAPSSGRPAIEVASREPQEHR